MHAWSTPKCMLNGFFTCLFWKYFSLNYISKCTGRNFSNIWRGVLESKGIYAHTETYISIYVYIAQYWPCIFLCIWVCNTLISALIPLEIWEKKVTPKWHEDRNTGVPALFWNWQNCAPSPPSRILLFDVMHAAYRHFSSAAELKSLFPHWFKNKYVQIHLKK